MAAALHHRVTPGEGEQVFFHEPLLTDLKRLANERDVPYQSLMKVYLAERVAEERGHRRRKAKV